MHWNSGQHLNKKLTVCSLDSYFSCYGAGILHCQQGHQGGTIRKKSRVSRSVLFHLRNIVHTKAYKSTKPLKPLAVSGGYQARRSRVLFFALSLVDINLDPLEPIFSLCLLHTPFFKTHVIFDTERFEKNLKFFLKKYTISHTKPV